MAQTLGEKLRAAREARGMSLSEVAEQTRISPYYIEAIERDDYKPLPGGIFNKGFVKSFAKYVGVDENEALADYLRLIAGETSSVSEEPKTYRPEVLTDSSSSKSSIPTVLIAVLILGGMTAAILFGLNYLYQEPKPAAVANTETSVAANTGVAEPAPTPATEASTPELATSKIEFRTVGQPVYLTATSDGGVTSSVVAAGGASTFEPKQSLRLSYSKSLAKAVALTINGKQITLPEQPLTPKRSVIEFEINKANFGTIWSSGSIVPPSNTVNPESSPTPAPSRLPVTAGTPPSGDATRPGEAPRSAANTRSTPRPTPAIRPTVIIVPSANRPRRNN